VSTISQKVIALIEDAISRGLTMGEDIDFDVSMIAMPGPQGQPQPVLALTFALNASVMGEVHATMALMSPAAPSQDDMDTVVRQVTANLVDVRTRATQAQMVQSNGHKPNPSGLIIPGQN
jgi:hypothetical protein